MAKKTLSNAEINTLLSKMFSYEVTVKEATELPFKDEQKQRYLFAGNEQVIVYQYYSQSFAVIGNDIYEF